MRIFWMVGEPSGDIQAAAVAAALGDHYPEVEQRGWGGPALENSGVQLKADITQTQFMGFVEVLLRARKIARMFKQVKADILEFAPHTLVLVDYPGFNLRLAKWAKEQGIRVVYYIPPKVWAWKSGRAKKLQAYCDEVLSILPFEQQWYAERGYTLTYVGNPLREKYAFSKAFNPESKKILLLPGSRRQEISRLLPEMITLAKFWPHWSYTVLQNPGSTMNLEGYELPSNVKVVRESLENLQDHFRFALVCSGTATLEVALLDIPQIVLYKANPLSLFIAKRLVDLKYFSLPNLILGEMAIPELLQGEVNAVNIAAHAARIISPPFDQIHAYGKLKELLQSEKPAENAARIIAGKNSK